MEAEVKAKYPDANIELVKGSGGIFDVVCDGQLIYSKQQTEGLRFPGEGEITRLMESRAG